jgi:hypothetical protein
MFDRQFFATVLPDHVRSTVAANPGMVPVIELVLGDRTVLDLCHIVRLHDAWLAVAYFCQDDAYDDVDIAFVPYQTVVRVNLTLRDASERRIGFSTGVESEPQPPATSD